VGGGGDDGAWLAETNLLDGLLDALGGGGGGGGEEEEEEEEREGGDDDASASRAANAAEVLVGIARAAPSALASKLAETASMTKLFERGLSPTSTADRYGVLDDAAGDGDGTPTTAHGGASASPLVNVLDIAISVIDGKRAQGPAQAMQAFLAMESGAAPEPPREAPESGARCAVPCARRVSCFTRSRLGLGLGFNTQSIAWVPPSLPPS
jgi:serine/threonine-protein phosphatase 6 regulatory subunit 3